MKWRRQQISAIIRSRNFQAKEKEEKGMLKNEANEFSHWRKYQHDIFMKINVSGFKGPSHDQNMEEH